MTRQWWVLTLLLLGAAVLGLGGGLWMQQRSNQVVDLYAGLGGDFTLAAGTGPVSLADYRDQVVMLFFGYTQCPDVCPTGLARMSAVLDGLTSEESAQVVGLFVSVDTERDTPRQVSDYAAFFHQRIVGVTGSADEIAAVAKKYYVLYQQVEGDNTALGYTIDHSASTYLIGRDGKVKGLVQHSISVGEMIKAVRAVLAS